LKSNWKGCRTPQKGHGPKPRLWTERNTHRACTVTQAPTVGQPFMMERMDMPPFYLAHPSPPLMAIHFSLPASFHGS